jgi:hypothetical protein
LRDILFDLQSTNRVLIPFILERDFQEAIAIGRTFAAMKDYQLDGNKEMVALGTMNIVGSMTSCYVATGETDAPMNISSILHFNNDNKVSHLLWMLNHVRQKSTVGISYF